MAGSKSSLTGEDFYGPYDAQETANKHASELGMQTVPSLNITYTEARILPLTFETFCVIYSKYVRYHCELVRVESLVSP